LINHDTIEISAPDNKKIILISDLHFDHRCYNYGLSNESELEADFIDHIRSEHKGSIICIAGDIYDDFRKTFNFVKLLEKKEIQGFFVLGNHDYWNNGTTGYKELIKLFDDETKDHIHFRYLKAGKKYYVGDICFIGDTGWTSFKRTKKAPVAADHIFKLPDVQKVKDFSLDELLAFHNEWISFANGVLQTEDKTIVITHFPMVSFARTDDDLWWSSHTELIDNKKSWNFFGHTHKSEKKYNNISSQIGYDKNREHRYCVPEQFAKFIRVAESREVVTSDYDAVSRFYTQAVVQSPEKEAALVRSIKTRGYRRSGANKKNLAALASDPERYLAEVRLIILGYVRNEYIGYAYTDFLDPVTVDSVLSSINILDKKVENIRAFITAAVITGYVWNGFTSWIPMMRPLDDYDIMRFYLMFITMSRYGITPNSVDSVRSNKNRSFIFNNVELCLPAVNGASLSMEEATEILRPLSGQGFIALPAGKENKAAKRKEISSASKDVNAVKICVMNEEARKNYTLSKKYLRGTGGVPMDSGESWRLLKLSAEQGYSKAQRDLGLKYAFLTGSFSWNVPADETEGAKWLRLAAEQGEPRAQLGLGVLYARGTFRKANPIPQDHTEAIKWFRLAAEQGDNDARNNLAWMYSNGRGVSEDKDEAIRLFTISAQNGSKFAQVSLGELYNGKGTDADHKEAIKWFRLAAEQGDPEAQYHIGKMYEEGRGVPESRSEAIKWYRLAAERYHQGAKKALSEYQ